ncbi:MAG TPA: DivIVA domain-containing protein [Candidatus Eremiobacteraceae bacterium]|nr:DivIVA domain-containing protein [Candidatus Eremiobacteraceae bacterium]
MKITPVDIQHKQFKKALQGYAREEVDSFLDEIIETLEVEIDERAKLEARVGELQEKVAQYKAMEESLQSALVLAQRTADEVKASAHKEADLVKQSAKLDLEQVLADVRTHIADAKRELQRHNDQVAAVKQNLRAFLARHSALLDEEVAAARDGGMVPSIPLPSDTEHDIIMRESS